LSCQYKRTTGEGVEGKTEQGKIVRKGAGNGLQREVRGRPPFQMEPGENPEKKGKKVRNLGTVGTQNLGME